MLGDIKRLPHATVRLGTPDASGVHVGSLERSDHAVPGQLVELPPFDPRGIVGQVGVGVVAETLPLSERSDHLIGKRRRIVDILVYQLAETVSARLMLHDSPVVAGRFVLDHRADGDRRAVTPRPGRSSVIGAVGDHDDERLFDVLDRGGLSVFERRFFVDLHTAAVSDVGVGDRELGVERFALMVERTRNAPVVRYGADDIDIEIVSEVR